MLALRNILYDIGKVPPAERERRENERFVQKYCAKDYLQAARLCGQADTSSRNLETSQNTSEVLSALDDVLANAEKRLGKRGVKAVQILKRGLPPNNNNEKTYDQFVSETLVRGLVYSSAQYISEVFATEGVPSETIRNSFSTTVVRGAMALSESTSAPKDIPKKLSELEPYTLATVILNSRSGQESMKGVRSYIID